MKYAIIYCHGFNSASVDLSGNLLTSKKKLVVLECYCKKNQIKFFTPNLDYRDFQQVIRELRRSFLSLEAEGYQTLFMGSSLGGFTSEYMAMKTNARAIMINPAIKPSKLLAQFIGVTENFEIKQAFDWKQSHCDQFNNYEQALENFPEAGSQRTLLLDMADELIDSYKTLARYQEIADVYSYEGGSHGFEHIEEALPVINNVIFND